MRKLSYLFSLLVLSIVCGGTAWADDGKYYSAGTVVTSVDQIKEGVDYALKGTGESPCSSTYLNVVMDGNGGSASLTSDCFYQFESAGTVDGKPAFYLKQKSNGMYLRKPGKPTDATFGYPNEGTPDGWGSDCLALTSDKNDAWQFWAGVAQSTDENDPFYYNKGTEGKEVMFVFTCTTVLTGDDAGDELLCLFAGVQYHHGGGLFVKLGFRTQHHAVYGYERMESVDRHFRNRRNGQVDVVAF